MKARGKKINVSSGPSKEIAGLKKMMKMKMMTPESQNSCVWEFLHETLKVRRGPLGLFVRTYQGSAHTGRWWLFTTTTHSQFTTTS